MSQTQAQIRNLQESLDRFRRGPEILEATLAGIPEDESRFIPAPGKWSIRQIARHVLDTEIVAGMRLRQIIAEDRPQFAVFDQDLWTERLNYNEYDIFDSAAKFRVLRTDMTQILESLPAATFDRVGLHPERGEETLGAWVARFGIHVEKHAGQIRRVREVWSQR